MYHYKSFAKDLAKLLIIALTFLYSVLHDVFSSKISPPSFIEYGKVTLLTNAGSGIHAF